jgi:hypothetical protein
VNTPWNREVINKELLLIDQNQPYAINLQMAVWDRELLIDVAEAVNGSPWDLEISLKEIFAKRENIFPATIFVKLVGGVYNAVIKGEVRWSLKLKYKNIKYNSIELPRQKFISEIKYLIKSTASEKIKNSFIRKIIKSILSMLGMKFYKEN